MFGVAGGWLVFAISASAERKNALSPGECVLVGCCRFRGSSLSGSCLTGIKFTSAPSESLGLSGVVSRLRSLSLLLKSVLGTAL